MFFKKDYRTRIERKTDKAIRSIEKGIIKQMDKGFTYYHRFDCMFLYEIFSEARYNIYYNYAYNKITTYFENQGYTVDVEYNRDSMVMFISWQSKVLKEKNNG